MYNYIYIYILELKRPNYLDNYPRTEHPNLFLCIWVLIYCLRMRRNQTCEIEIGKLWWLVSVLLHVTSFIGL